MVKGKLILPNGDSFLNIYKKNADVTFGGAFPSGTPIPNAEAGREIPRSYQVKTGQNVIITPRSEVPSATPFEVLNFVAKSTDLLQIAEFILLNQISARTWDILPIDPSDKSDYTNEIKLAVEFFKSPDKERSYSRWLRKALKNITRYDAFCVYKRRDKKGRLYGLSIIDGSTIKPIVDSNGNRPIAPEVAYQQIIYGTPRGEWSSDDMIYAPLSEELVGNYGVSPVERILVATMKYLNKQAYDYAYYNQGATPDGGLYALRPNDQSPWDPGMIKEFEDNWLATMSNVDKRQSLKFVPDGTYVKTKEYNWDTKQEQWFGRLVCTSYGIPQAVFNAATTMASAKTEDRQQTELGLQPYITFIEELFTDILQKDLGFEHLKFNIVDEKREDADAKVSKNTKYLSMGIYNRNEIRQEEGKDPIPGGEEYTVIVGNAVIPLDKIGELDETSDMVGDPNKGESTGVRGLDTKSIDTKGNTITSNVAKPEVATGSGSLIRSDDVNTLRKSLNNYRNFLIKRFKRNRTLFGYRDDSLSDDLIKTIENELHDVSSISYIFDLFKALDDEGVPELEAMRSRFVNILVEQFGLARADVIKYLEPKYPNVTLDDIQEMLAHSEDIHSLIVGLHMAGVDKGANQLNNIPKIVVKTAREEAASLAQKYAGTLIKGIDESTRSFVGLTVHNALARGENWGSVKTILSDPKYFPFSEARAKVIAVTEEARALNIGAVTVWKNSGIVKQVKVSDTDGCTICNNVNGQVWSLEQAESNPIEHPNCRRSFTPIIMTPDEINS